MKNVCQFFKNGFAYASALAAMAFVAGCTNDNVAGGASGDAGVVAVKNLDVAGVTQKGPFVKGSAVTVQGIDCKTLKLTDERFDGTVQSDKGDFVVEDISLMQSCAVFVVTGKYRSELSGKTTDGELTLRALTNLKDRENVNVNILTNLEYERVMYLVTEKGKLLAEAKTQAEKEVLAAFDIAGSFEEFENLNIFESGDGNAALLAVSVMMQSGVDVNALVDRMDKFDDTFAENGVWSDTTTKAAITKWSTAAATNGNLDSIRSNIQDWGIAADIPAFEKFVQKFGADSSDSAQNTMTDARDGQTYRTVKIGNQVWMAENLNYKTDKSYCYNDSAEYCATYGRLYAWDAAKLACPADWHLPTNAEFEVLFSTVGGQFTAGIKLKSTSGWGRDGNGSDDFSFSALPAGNVGVDGNFYNDKKAYFWSSTEHYSDVAYFIRLDYGNDSADLVDDLKILGYSVRCVKDNPNESVKVVQDSVSYQKPCKTDEEDSCEYGSLKDGRDGQTYKTVKIGNLEWMAENLNYAYLQPTDSLDSSSFCFNDSVEYCDKYGRLYLWSAAMDSAGQFSSGGKGCGYGVNCSLAYKEPLRGVCPEGWHLPSIAEWNYLSSVVYNSSVDGTKVISGKKLKSTTGWRDDDNGLDEYGFSVFPAGSRFYPDGSYSYEGLIAHFWGYGMDDETDAFSVDFEKGNDGIRQDAIYEKHYAFSVRCVKD